MNLKLTISILLSDRLSTIEKCLESLVPLLQQVPSELILTITGKDPKVRELAEQYTEHIIDYTWIDNFSDARNVGLKAARGEWFLFLDDDEWFDDVMPIVDFFTSGEEKKYKSATYRVRNYGDWEGKSYYESHSARLVRKTDELSFVGAVHEHFNKLNAPMKELTVFVHHYGYIQKKRGVGTQKVSRNLPLLLQMIEKEPNNQGIIVQIVQEYANTQDLEQVEFYCKQGLLLPVRYHNPEHDGYLYTILAKMRYTRHGVKEGIVVAQEAIKCAVLNEASKMQLWGVLVNFYIIAREYQKTTDALEQYLKLYHFFEQNLDIKQEQTRGLVFVDEIMRLKGELCYQGVLAALSLENEEKISQYLQEFPWDSPKMLESYYRQIYTLLKENSLEKRKLLRNCLAKIESEDEFIILQKLIKAHEDENIEEVLKYVEQSKESKDIRVKLYLIWLAGTYSYEIKELVTKMTIDQWQLLLIELLKLVEVEEYDSYCNVMKELLGEESPYYKQLLFRFLEQDLLDRQMSGEELQEGLDCYTQVVVDYYKDIYQDEMTKEENRYLLHVEYAFSLYYQESLQEGNDRIECLKKAKNAYPRMLVVIKRFMEHLLREYDKQKQVGNAEFQQLGVQVKQQVKQMIDNQQYDVALPIVSQLIQLLPNDLEVIRLKQQILTKMNE